MKFLLRDGESSTAPEKLHSSREDNAEIFPISFRML